MNPDLSLLLIALQQPQVGEQGHAQGTAATNPVDKLRSFVAQQQQQQQFHNHHSTATAPSSSSSSLNHTPAVVAFSACNGITPAVMQTVLDQLSSSSLGATVKRLSLKQNERMHELLVYRKTVMERHDGWRDELFAK